MNKYSIFLFLLFFVFVSCKKEKADEPKIADPEFTTCNCSGAEPGKTEQDEYLKGIINGVAVFALASSTQNITGCCIHVLLVGSLYDIFVSYLAYQRKPL